MIRVDAARDEPGGWTIAISVDGSSSGLLGRAAALWDRYQLGDPLGALAGVDELVAPVLDGAIPSPLPGVIAALVHLRVEMAAHLAWLPRMAFLYPEWPDFAVLIAEQELRTASASDVGALARAAATVLSSLPFTAEVMGYAAAQVAAVRRSAAIGPGELVADRPDWTGTEGLFTVLAAASRSGLDARAPHPTGAAAPTRSPPVPPSGDPGG